MLRQYILKGEKMSENPIVNFTLAPGETLHCCPYNYTHVVTNFKLSEHVERCRRRYFEEMRKMGSRADMVHCRLNERHLVPRVEQFYHAQVCPDLEDKTVEHLMTNHEMKMKKEKEKNQETPSTSKLSDDSSRQIRPSTSFKEVFDLPTSHDIP